MKKKFYSNTSCLSRTVQLLSCSTLLCCFIVNNNVSAGKIYSGLDNRCNCNVQDTSTEKKVDYIEEIYFSGKNKEGLNTMILITLQKLDGKQATTAVAKQYAFLSGVQTKAEEADNSCEVLELLATGIYGIDASYASLQNIPRPSDKASKKTVDVVSGMNGMSNTANTLAWSSWYLSKGSVSGMDSYGKLSGAAGKLGQGAILFGEGKKILETGKTFRNLIKKDKSCDKVAAKSIEIGAHVVPQVLNSVSSNAALGGPTNNTNGATLNATNGTTQNNTVPVTAGGIKITIKNVTYNQHSAIALGLEKVSGISAVNSDDFNSNTGNILVTSTMRTKEIVDKIIQSNPSLSFAIESTSSAGASLLIKTKIR